MKSKSVRLAASRRFARICIKLSQGGKLNMSFDMIEVTIRALNKAFQFGAVTTALTVYTVHICSVFGSYIKPPG